MDSSACPIESSETCEMMSIPLVSWSVAPTVLLLLPPTANKRSGIVDAWTSFNTEGAVVGPDRAPPARSSRSLRTTLHPLPSRRARRGPQESSTGSGSCTAPAHLRLRKTTMETLVSDDRPRHATSSVQSYTTPSSPQTHFAALFCTLQTVRPRYSRLDLVHHTRGGRGYREWR